MPAPNWTKGEILLLRELHGAGKSAGQIAAALRTKTRSAVLGKIRRLGLAKKQTGQARTNRARADTMRRARGKRTSYIAPEDRPKPSLPVCKKIEGEPKSKRLTIFELTEVTCKWPHGDEPPYEFCGHPSEGAYCSFHTELATNGKAWRYY